MEKIKSIWHPEIASLKGVGPDGQLTRTDPPEYFANIASGATASDESEILAADKIISLEFTSPRTVLAKVEIAERNAGGDAVVYTDFISLVKIADSWTVVSKLWAARPLSAASFTEPAPLDQSHAEIASALLAYFNGQLSAAGSSATLKTVFHSGALLRGPTGPAELANGELRVLDAGASFY